MKINVFVDNVQLRMWHSVLFLFAWVLGFFIASFCVTNIIFAIFTGTFVPVIAGIIVFCTAIPFAIIMLPTILYVLIKQRRKE